MWAGWRELANFIFSQAYSCPVQETLCVILLPYNYTAQGFITAPTITSLFDPSHLPSRHVGHTHTHSHNADTHSLVPRFYMWRSQGPRLDTHTHTIQTHHTPQTWKNQRISWQFGNLTKRLQHCLSVSLKDSAYRQPKRPHSKCHASVTHRNYICSGLIVGKH